MLALAWNNVLLTMLSSSWPSCVSAVTDRHRIGTGALFYAAEGSHELLLDQGHLLIDHTWTARTGLGAALAMYNGTGSELE